MPLDTIGVIAACLAFGVVTFWSKSHHFDDTGEFNRDMKVLLAVNVAGLLSIVYVAASAPLGGWPTVAMALYFASFALMAWSFTETKGQDLPIAFSTAPPARLVTTGPYAWVRHPFYMAYMLFWSAAPVATGRVWLAVFPLVLAILYRKAARAEEERFARSWLAQDYASYARRVPGPAFWLGR